MKSKNFNGETTLSKLPYNTYFKIIKKDGTLSKKIYKKTKGSWNPYSKKYDITSVDDVLGAGREMKGTIKVSTRFTY